MIGARNIKGGLALLALSLVGGLAMSLYAFAPMLAAPDEPARGLLRLAHVAAVMLPLLNIVLGLLLDRIRLSTPNRERASYLILVGAAALPLALAVEAFVPAIRDCHIAGPPSVAFTLGVVLIAVGAWRTPKEDLIRDQTLWRVRQRQ